MTDHIPEATPEQEPPRVHLTGFAPVSKGDHRPIGDGDSDDRKLRPVRQHGRNCTYLAGRRTALLASGHRDAGRYTIVWDGCDESGRRVASGIYFARMVAPDYVTTRKMILLK